MFLIKSTFWLGLAFIVIQPQNLDFNAKKNTISNAALNAGQKALISQLNSTSCNSFECSATKALLLSNNKITTPKTALPMQEAPNLTSSKSQLTAPIPQPRLKRSG